MTLPADGSAAGTRDFTAASLLACDTSVSYTHLTLPTIYSV